MSQSQAHATFEGAEGRTALLVIDMQNAFFEDQMLAAARQELVVACNALVRAARAGGAPVLVIGTEHMPDRSTWTVSMRDDDQGFIFGGTDQARIVDGLEVEGEERVLKTRDSAFFGTGLAERLRDLGVDRVVLAGVSTHNCVAHTGADAFASDLRAAYARSAIGSTNTKYAAAMLEMLSAEYRQPILSQVEAEAALGRSAGTPG
ncbi:cysteine hydrolase [Arthrobacter sp. RIT-PI-e]|uniref:cysteine hydrolase family protein n=1 Tax=Arthrobacter sp. RIT-PI-e TaxID=1681197 RepID=UPI0006760F2F|nr:isochorismatase family cysteine hydrolase [Arthrobacter sp. RIT-PI-e]KNC17237.1 cysteine hydrolase [Arthrobacter sp. RIT-PI-e]